ncbi:MAG: sulfatase [Saprospiraceae bacterium]|nr:sulfatase [Saprospiraceae bacterium]
MRTVAPTAIFVYFWIMVMCSTSCQPPDETAATPNIVFILADDLGWADLPAYGNQFHETPNIDKLVAEGMRFTNAYAACPVCSPTRASIQSGQYPARLGIIDFITGHWRPHERLTVPKNKTQFLPLEIETIGEVLKQANYSTGYFGKWHLGNEPYFPEHQGYDESVIFHGSPYYKFSKRLKPPQDFPDDKILSEALTDLSIDFINKHHEKPFFLTLAHYDVHVQLDADSGLIEKYLEKPRVENHPCNAVYAAMVEHIDNSVGRIMETLSTLGLSDNTLVVFFSDNGGLVSRFDEVPLIAESKRHFYAGDSLMLHVASSNAPLRAEKGTVYEGGIREPMIVKWPGVVPAGSTSDALISSIDLLPTFREIAGVTDPIDQVVDGESFLATLSEGEYDPDRSLFWHYPVYHHDVPASVIRKGDWKLIHKLDNDELFLYDLSRDVGEQHNLAESEVAIRDALKSQLDQWRTEVAAEMPVPNAQFDAAKRKEWGTHPDRQK